MGTRRGLLIAGLLASLLGPPPAHAVEYRLEVANLWETALYPFAKPAELRDGASGPGLERLEASLDQGAMPHAVFLRDRTLRWSSEAVAHAYGTVRVLAEIKAAGDGTRWDEVRWEGKPGERSVWMVLPSERGLIWDRYVSKSLDLGDGLGAVVGENFNQAFPDTVYLIVQQGAEPTTYKAVLLWRDPAYNFEAPR